MNDDYEELDGEEILENARGMAGRIRWDNLHDEEDASQDAALAMWEAKLRAKEGLPVRHFQRKSGKGAVLNFYNANQKRREHEFLSLTKRVPRDDGELEFIDIIPEQSGASHAERLDATEQDISLMSLVDTLPEKEQVIIRLRFFQEMTLAEIGAQVGCTAEYVRQVEENILAILRHRWEANQK